MDHPHPVDQHDRLRIGEISSRADALQIRARGENQEAIPDGKVTCLGARHIGSPAETTKSAHRLERLPHLTRRTRLQRSLEYASSTSKKTKLANGYG
jgi:hypothetical protein